MENGERLVVAETPDGERHFKSEVILLAAGRVARVEGLGLEQTTVEMDNVFIRADEQLRTSAPNIWSLGDATMAATCSPSNPRRLQPGLHYFQRQCYGGSDPMTTTKDIALLPVGL